MPNLRVVYNNLADANTPTTSNTIDSSYPLASLKSDNKGTVTRPTATNVPLSITASTVPVVAGTTYAVVMAFTNAVSGTLTVSGSTVVAPVAIAADIISNSTAIGVYAYSYGNAKYLVGYFVPSSTGNVNITMVATAGSTVKAEVSRFIIGPCFIPTYNTEYGLEVGFTDSTTNNRSQAGNVVTNNGTTSKRMTFNLPYLIGADRDLWYQILRINGMRKAMFVSLFPQDTDPLREQTFQLYGKLSNMSSITHSNPTVFNSSVSIEEV